MSLNVTQTAIEGFRLIARRPVSFIVWATLAALAWAALSAGIAWALGWPDLAQWGNMSTAAAVAPLLARLAGVGLAGCVMLVILQVALATAVLRAALEPSRRAFAYVRLGADEGRYLVYYLLLVVIEVAVIAAAWGGVFALVLAPLVLAAKWIGGALIVLAALVVLFFVPVRLCLAGPITVAERRIGIGASWRQTKGIYWPLLGMVLLAAVLAGAVNLPLSMLSRPMMYAIQAAIASRQPLAMTPVLWVELAAALVGLGLSVAFARAIVLGAFAAAYRAIASPGAALAEGPQPS